MIPTQRDCSELAKNRSLRAKTGDYQDAGVDHELDEGGKLKVAAVGTGCRIPRQFPNL
jgi:hypothetical protein